jgi:hypothetical protein
MKSTHPLFEPCYCYWLITREHLDVFGTFLSIQTCLQCGGNTANEGKAHCIIWQFAHHFFNYHSLRFEHKTMVSSFFAILWCNYTSHSTQFELAKFSYRSFVWVPFDYFACQVEKIRPQKTHCQRHLSQRLTLVSQLGSHMIDKPSSIHLCMKTLTSILLNFVTQPVSSLQESSFKKFRKAHTSQESASTKDMQTQYDVIFVKRNSNF